MTIFSQVVNRMPNIFAISDIEKLFFCFKGENYIFDILISDSLCSTVKVGDP